MFGSYRARLMVALAAMMLAGQLISAVLFLTRLPAVTAQVRLDELRDQTGRLASQLFPSGVPTTLDAATQQRLADAAGLLHGGILVSDAHGEVLHTAGNPDLPTKMIALSVMSQVLAQDSVTVADVSGAPVHQVLLGAPIHGPAGKEAALLVAVPVRELGQPATVLLPTMATSLAIALVLSLAVALVLAEAVAAPVQQLTAATEAVARGDYSQQVAVTSNDELGRLGARFNEMIREVARSRQTLKDLTINISHDLKTPVSIIQGFAEALVDGTAATPAEQAVAAKAILREAHSMGRMIQELLDLARLESGQITLAREPIDLAQFGRSLDARFRPLAESGDRQFDVDLPDDLPPVSGDPVYLERAIANLVDNALGHTPAGGRVVLKGYTAQDGQATAGPTAAPLPPGHWVVLVVADTGPGIPAEDLERLFERFYQSDKSRSRRHSQTGLGLAIVREIAEQHGGHVWARSEPGRGSEFALALPAA